MSKNPRARSQKKATWQACPAPRTSLQKLKYVKTCSEYLATCMRQERKTDPRAQLPLTAHILPAILYRRCWKGSADITTASIVQLKGSSCLADWGYDDTVSLSCVACNVSLKSGKFPRYTLVFPHSPRAFMPLCRRCGKG